VRIPVVDAASGASRDLDLQPSKIIGVGTNYRAHAAEMGKPVPAEPLIFLKPPSAMAGPGDRIVRPSGYQRVDFEGELVVVIGKPAHRVSAAAAMEHVLGLTCGNDVTVRDLQARDGQWTRAKGFDGFFPLGPRIVRGLDPRDLRISSRVNGTVRQDSSTSDMIFGVAELVAFVSGVMTLLPGDLITTGTPQGVGNLTPGDTVDIEIAGIGVLSNPVVGE
jgi:2-keto-4-pentenoate hydratase/2-oxohepta-3-ene-1,7-dioic acid hydratase in catechol pathway